MGQVPKPGKVPVEEAFVVTIGVSHQRKDADCSRALSVLARAGFTAGPTSDDAILQLAEQVELNRQLADNDPED